MAGNKSKVFQISILKMILLNEAIADLGDLAGVQPSTGAGNIYLRLYDTDVVDADNAGTEASYTGYVAGGIPITRSGTDWIVDEVNIVGKNVQNLQFGKCAGIGQSLRYWSIWKDNTTQALSHRMYHGQLPNDQIVVLDSIPTIPTNFLTVKEI